MKEVTFENIAHIPFFFIIGRPRSGTTLIRMILDAHPNILVPPESPLILRLYNKYRKIKTWDTTTKEKFVADLFSVRKFEYWNIDREKLRQKILEAPETATFQELVRLAYFYNKSPFCKKDILLLGDKNPVYSIPVKRISKIFPDARYIYITRDYRDQILSMLRVKLLIPDLVFLAFRWKLSARNVLSLRKMFPEKFYSFRYEDFVVEPEKYTRGICGHLGIEFDPAMLKYYEEEEKIKAKFPKEQFELFFSNLFKPIQADKVGQWKEKMIEDDVRIAEMVTGKYGKLLGYQPAHPFCGRIYIRILPEIIRQQWLYLLRFIFRKTPNRLKRLLGLEEKRFTKLVNRDS